MSCHTYYQRTPSIRLIKSYNHKYGKYLTCLEELPEHLNQELLIIDLMKNFSCKGHISFDCEIGMEIRLHGDYMEWVKEFLIVEVGLEEGSFGVYGLDDRG